MKTVSVVISAYNEEAHLEHLLRSVEWADEIIVVDNESTDKTAAIAKKWKAKVIKAKNNLMLNTNKNLGFMEAKSDWILNLDGDESVPADLAQEILEILQSPTELSGYWIPRKNIIFGKWIKHGIWWPDRQLRLFKTGKGMFPCLHIHEYLKVEGETGELKNPMEHINYETISQFFHKLNSIYTENEASVREERGDRFHWSQFIREPFGDFASLYFAKSGYKDGVHGLVLAILQSIYTFAVIAKRWEKKGFTEEYPSLSSVKNELTKANRDITYWYYSSRLSNENNGVKRILLKLLRKYASIH